VLLFEGNRGTHSTCTILEVNSGDANARVYAGEKLVQSDDPQNPEARPLLIRNGHSRPRSHWLNLSSETASKDLLETQQKCSTGGCLGVRTFVDSLGALVVA